MPEIRLPSIEHDEPATVGNNRDSRVEYTRWGCRTGATTMTTYTCWIPEYGHGREDGRPVKAGDPEHAACKYMED